MKKLLVFDMDGTIADLYNVNNWLEMLRAEVPTPYAIAKPMYDMAELRSVLLELKSRGWRVAVTTWLSMDSSAEYERQVADVKQGWLDKFAFPYDEFHPVSYGEPKHEVTTADVQILIDDNTDVRESWKEVHKYVINANENILESLRLLLI